DREWRQGHGGDRRGRNPRRSLDWWKPARLRQGSVRVKIALLTGGQDPPYAFGLLRELLSRGIHVVGVGNDELAHIEASGPGTLEFHNLVGTQSQTHLIAKVWRVLRYYGR